MSLSRPWKGGNGGKYIDIQNSGKKNILINFVFIVLLCYIFVAVVFIRLPELSRLPLL